MSFTNINTVVPWLSMVRVWQISLVNQIQVEFVDYEAHNIETTTK